MLERTITINGFSKGFAMTGWRLGFAAAASPIAQAMARFQSVITTGANQFVQRAAVAALQGPRDDVRAMNERYRQRRNFVLAALRAINGIKIGDIPGTFYAFPDVSAYFGKKSGNHQIENSERLCDFLLEQHGVSTVPGSAFGAEGSIRLSFAASDADLKKALHRIAQGLQSLS